MNTKPMCYCTFAENKIEIIENEIKTIYIDKNKNSSFRKIKDSIKVYKTKRNKMHSELSQSAFWCDKDF